MPKELYYFCPGVYWKYNVFQGDIPVKEFGKIYYVVDDYGNAVIVYNPSRLAHSLRK